MKNNLHTELREFKFYNSHSITKKEYSSIHHWLRYNYGKATKCENKNCLGTSQRFEWALIKGKEYEKRRENFFQLCKSCHTRHDFTDETKRKISKYFKGRKQTKQQLKNHYIPVSQYTRDGVFIKTYPSLQAATKATGVRGTNIHGNNRGIYHHAGGYVWRYKGRNGRAVSKLLKELKK